MAVHAAFAARRAEWVLLFDNASGPEAVAVFLPSAGRRRVLITSRNALWPPGQAVEVPVLDIEQAAGFLAARTGDTDWQAEACLDDQLPGGEPQVIAGWFAPIRAGGPEPAFEELPPTSRRGVA